jgi:hypothetical protein
MTAFLIVGIALVVAFLGGFYAGVKNANSSKISRGKELLDALKGKK